MAWGAVKGDRQSKRLKCRCGNQTFLIFREPMARQVRTLTAKHRRVVARCPVCGRTMRLKRGAPN
jgi:hypothetical protein